MFSSFSKRLLTFIFSVRVSFWLFLLPWPQAWGHISLVSWVRSKIYSIFWFNWNNFLKEILLLWVLILIWLLSDVISSSLKKIGIDQNFSLIWWCNIRFVLICTKVTPDVEFLVTVYEIWTFLNDLIPF